MFDINPEADWKGTPTGLKEHLENLLYTYDYIVRSKYWVQNAKGVMNAIRRNRKALDKVGITVEVHKVSGNKTNIRIYKPSEVHPFDEEKF